MSIRIKIKNSVVCLGGFREDELRDKIKGFDLSDKTPIDCMDFLRELKKICQNSK